MVVVGGGYTGLWTAYYLSEAEASLDIAVLEAEQVGFGASGRNGGWCSALFPASPRRLAAQGGREAVLAQHAAMRASVAEVGRVVAREGIDADYARGGTLALARNPAQLARAEREVAEARAWGRGPEEIRLLDASEAAELVGASQVVGATYTPDCAALHPLRLAHGLGEVLRRRGVRLHESTPVTEIRPGEARTAAGVMRARSVIRATEGYSPRLPGHRRTVAPVYSLMVATEPLEEDLWRTIGLRRRETFTDHRHLVIYGQRTADGRLAFGGRGAPYHFGSRVDARFDAEPRVFGKLAATLAELFPALAGVEITHRWGGPLAIPRDWFPSVGLDPSTGIGWAGGYAGDGVSTANLAGRTLRDLVLGRSTELTGLPWVGHRSPAWEPEPLRWLGVNAGLRVAALADREEAITGRPSVLARLAAPVLG